MKPVTNRRKGKTDGKGSKTSHHANDTKPDRASDVESYGNYELESDNEDQVNDKDTDEKV
eukprot:CAMPEP_0172503556 /NCGR_PEP_ID=MMETSP1066-20121228/170413_1 /TAXON_ID=671091 /ORGANISM="Coscinodiscus wailesii, Strain CCMP2513" /LENGTH=59 /DNA_ID=CAMNT_0013279349 /DNA_START=91 /DNA_END=271 /DNA_ORIENTATION=+